MQNFTINSAALLKKLVLLSGVINASNSVPILDNFLFEVKETELKITSSDLETTMTTTVEVESTGNSFIAIPAKLLTDILKTFADQPLTFSVLANGTIEISSLSGIYNIAYYPGAEFPESPALEKLSETLIPSKILATAIGKTIFAAGSDDLRPIMSGVLFQLSTTGLTFVATDAHKLVKYHRSDLASTQDANFVMPKKPLNVLKSVLSGLDEEVALEYNDTNAVFTFESYVLSCRLVDGKYPNYEGVIPKDNPNIMTVNRNLFLNAVKRSEMFSNKTTKQIALSFTKSKMVVYAEDLDYSNKANENLVCNYEGDDMRIGFNSRYLIEMLNNNVCEEIQLEMSQPNRAGILKPIDGLSEGEQVLMLVMPSVISNK